ncbi:hypothetical protein LCGC14_1033940 [marine sediment metagenome]|uniref:Uncharacterized protein n=1 Tax=marine sediment metagenome TaxID=412755 RepID=A0A0F9NFE4_9ZZZZ
MSNTYTIKNSRGTVIATINETQKDSSSTSLVLQGRGAKEYGFDEEAYIGAMRRVPVIIEDMHKKNLEVLARLTEMLAEMGLKQKRQLETEQALRESRESFKALVEFTHAIHWEMDLATNRFTYISPQIETILGYTPDRWATFELWAETVHPDDREYAVNYCSTEAGKGEDHAFVYRSIAADGRTVWLHDIIKVIMSAGKPIKLIGIMMDITERKNAEEELLRTQFSMDKTRDAVYWMCPDARFIYVNDSATEALGYTREELLTMSVDDIAPGRLEDIWPEYWKELSEKGSIVFESEHKRKDGSVFPVEISVNYMKFGLKEYNCAFARDITERKAAEKKIKDSLQEKELLLSEIHHRVKNNMAVMSSLLGMQSKFVKDKDDRKMFLDTQKRIKSMALIHDKLYKSDDFSSIDIKDYIESLVRELVKSFQTSSNNINFKVDVGDVHVGIDEAVPYALILNELIMNSLKYAFQENGSGEIEVGLNPFKEDRLQLIVRDNGCGLPEGLDFRRSESFGLQIVNSLVSQLNGEIEIDSNNSNRGTSFNIIFPRPDYKKRI